MKRINFGEKHDAPLALALGFFDCVHKGHAAVISSAREYAAAHGCECAVFTFSNDPGAFVKRARIYTFEERAEALRGLGVDVIVAAEFDSRFAALSREHFATVLRDTLDLRAIRAGEDYTYGAQRAGDASTLDEDFGAYGVDIGVLPLIRIAGEEEKISSTAVKEALSAGDIARANALLSEPYFMLGRVSHAHGRGGTFGFPTANIPFDSSRLAPAPGVYATKVTVEGKVFLGGTNVGTKPTFGDEKPSVETFILDFDGDIYGKNIKLAFHKRLRGISDFGDGDIYGKNIKLAFHKRLRGISDFGSVDELAEQLGRDVARIREIFAEANDEK